MATTAMEEAARAFGDLERRLGADGRDLSRPVMPGGPTFLEELARLAREFRDAARGAEFEGRLAEATGELDRFTTPGSDFDRCRVRFAELVDEHVLRRKDDPDSAPFAEEFGLLRDERGTFVGLMADLERLASATAAFAEDLALHPAWPDPWPPAPTVVVEAWRSQAEQLRVAALDGDAWGHHLIGLLAALPPDDVGERWRTFEKLADLPFALTAVRRAAEGLLRWSPECSHSDDFRRVVWRGTEYHLSKVRAAIIRVLWRRWEQGLPEMPEKELLKAAGSESDRIQDVFKPLRDWSGLVCKSGASMVRLTPGGAPP